MVYTCVNMYPYVYIHMYENDPISPFPDYSYSSVVPSYYTRTDLDDQLYVTEVIYVFFQN